ncbi:glycosyltransferase [Rickettsiales endosymbiont of Peranema trichophorum]|uniref:glycosyltransferase family 2 protein n=1 Tax=Rickettsiales endosymbiont of Peranema trichophorum TaxID=2486577 RepID=UPI001023DFDC|nr:glycosyltransferase family 2 protein [Rickettsiales endosymbiont of Peranema trichophorum]RZI45151.1 glycosyltransferase [Rickettsiales endosymbiont of Peranema trichophorum]
MKNVTLSVVIPVMNEAENVAPLLTSLQQALNELSYEVIFVDDGSTDSTCKEILKCEFENTRLLVFSRNFGQTCALTAGIDAARGEYIATIDGDLQNDPSDIPAMLQKLISEDLDMLTGVRTNRNDNWVLRKIPSKIANFIIRKLSGTNINDLGCTLKVFRSTTAKNLRLYGELHRFIPVVANIQGAKIAEMPVKHHKRQFGHSKYGISRTFSVLSDLTLLLFLQRYNQRPMHLFGTIAFTFFAIGSTIGLYMLYQKVLGHDIGHRPLFLISILCIMASMQFVTTGFIAELLVRVYYNPDSNKPYRISSEYRNGKLV